MVVIYTEPQDVWIKFMSLIYASQEEDPLCIIAEDEAIGVEIYASSDEKTGFPKPKITVLEDGEEVFAETCMTYQDCTDTVQYTFDIYLGKESVVSGDEYEEFERDEMIANRESDLDDAVYQMLDVFLENSENGVVIPDFLIDDVKEHICEYLARQKAIDIWRPMYLEDEDGEFFEEFPYDCLVFEDEAEKKGA